MVDYKYSELFKRRHVDKQLKIATEDRITVLTNKDIHAESFELTEGISSSGGDLEFGTFEASMVKFRINNTGVSLKDKWIVITMTLNGNVDEPFTFGRYKVNSDQPTADRMYRDITAYDQLYDLLNTDVSAWYNSLLPTSNSTVTLRQFRDSFFAYFKIEQETDYLINDTMVVEKTIEPSEISAEEVLKCILQINGAFGCMSRTGKFKYITLDPIGMPVELLYPGATTFPGANTFPLKNTGTEFQRNEYISCQYEDYTIKTIDKVQIRQEENDIGAIAGTGNNAYVVEDNFLVYGKSTEDLGNIAKNVLNVVKDIVYQPVNVECVGNPCVEVGDSIGVYTKDINIFSYVLQRTFKGIQNLRDTYLASGDEYRNTQVNSINKSIVQLKGKTNTLERTVEETKSTITDVEKQLYSEILQTASKISLQVAKDDTGKVTGIEVAIVDDESQIIAVSDMISLEGEDINITGNRLYIKSDNFELNNVGRIRAVKARFQEYIALFTSEDSNVGSVFLHADDTTNTIYISKNNRLEGDGDLSCRDITCDDIDCYSIECTNINCDNIYYADSTRTSSNAPSLTINANGYIATSTQSSKRFKKDIIPVEDKTLNPQNLLKIPIYQYKYTKEYLNDENDNRYDKDIIGFMAEDFDKIYPVACEYDKEGNPVNWNERYVIPPMLKLIQEHDKKINEQQKQIDELKEMVNRLIERS